MDWSVVLVLFLGLASSNLLPGDKRLGHHQHHHHHHDEHHHSDDHHSGHNHEHHHEAAPDSLQLESHHKHPIDQNLSKSRRPKSRSRSGKNLDLSQAVLDPETGLRCVKMETDILTQQRESLLTCRHRSVNICHFTYVTKFKPFTPRICEEIYKKKCNIVFSDQAENVTEEACYTPYRQQCDDSEDDIDDEDEEEEKCVTVSDSSCVTRYVPKRTADGQMKHVGQTSCDKVPRTLCSSRRCGFVQEAPVCHNKTRASVSRVPSETCDLSPATICRNANKLVPHLEPVEKCEESPREVCSYGVKDPEVKKRPLVTKWCYNDTDPDTAGDFVFGEKLIKKDRNPKSNKFKHKAIPPSAAPLLISRNPLVVPKIHNEVIDEVRVNEDVNDKKKPKKPSIFGNKLISQSLLPPKLPSNDQDRPAKKKNVKKPKQNISNEQKTKDDGFSEFIDDFINTGNNQDPESPKIDKSNTEDDIVDAELISDVFRFEDDIKKDEVIKPNKDENTSGLGKIDFLTREESIPDLGSLAKVVNHEGDSPVSKTIIIQNNPRAHKAFGVKNPPRKFSNRHRAPHPKLNAGASKADRGESRDAVKGPAKSISRDQKNDHIDFLFGVHGAEGDGIIAEQPSHFGFGISEISEEEKEQYRSPASSEFNFKSGWKNKDLPPALAELLRNSHNSLRLQNVEKDEDFEKKSRPGNDRPEISSNKNSNTNYGVQEEFQNNLRNSQHTRDDFENPASILSRDQNSFKTQPGNTFNSNHKENFVYDTDTFGANTREDDDDDVGANNSNEQSFIQLGDRNGNKASLRLEDENKNNYEEFGRESDEDGTGPVIVSNLQSQFQSPIQSDFEAQEFHGDYFQPTDVGSVVGVVAEDHIRAEHNGQSQNFAPFQSNQEFQTGSNPSSPSGGKSVVINLVNQNIDSKPENQNQFLFGDQTTESFIIGGFVSDDFSFQPQQNIFNQNSPPAQQDVNTKEEFSFSLNQNLSPPPSVQQNSFSTNFPSSQDFKIVDDTASFSFPPNPNLPSSPFSGGSNVVVNSFNSQQQQQDLIRQKSPRTQKEFRFPNADSDSASLGVIEGSSRPTQSRAPDAGVGDTQSSAHSQHGVASFDQNNGGFSENSSPALSNYATSSFARQNTFSAPRPEQFKTPDTVLKPSELLGTATGKSIQKNVKVASVAASSSGAGLVSQGLAGSYTSAANVPVSSGASVNDNQYKSQQSVQNGPVSSYQSPSPQPASSITDRPSSSDLFKPPSTLLYGFVPMTTEKVTSYNPPQTISGAQTPNYSSVVGASKPINYQKPNKKPSYRPGNKSKPSYKPSAGDKRNPKHLVIDVISKFLAPITETLNNLLRG